MESVSDIMNESEVICRVWRVEQEILDVFHEICVENKLKYTLAYGKKTPYEMYKNKYNNLNLLLMVLFIIKHLLKYITLSIIF